MNYEFFLRSSFDFYGRRKRKQLPQPNQLRPTADQAGAWQDFVEKRWSEPDGERSGMLAALPLMAQYQLDHSQGLPAQGAMTNDLLVEARSRANLNYFLGGHLLGTRYLDEMTCVAEFGHHAVEKALEIGRLEMRDGFLKPETAEAPSDVELWQACFGLPAIDRDASAVCAVCPQKGACIKMSGLVLRATEQQCGNSDPIARARREAQRRRTAEHRARKKGKLPSS